MKTNKLLLLFLSLTCSQLFAQDEEHLVRSVLTDYIEGTANGEIERLKSAFHAEANLYYIQDDDLRSRSAESYIALFKEGVKNNRLAHIVSVNVSNDAAVGIVEVDMPRRNRRYTDYMLLLKEQGKWKIVHKSYTFNEYDRKGKMLFVVSNESSFGENNRRTGTHYGELVLPYHRFQEEGYEVDIVSPMGGEIPVSYINLQDSLQLKYFYDQKLQSKLSNTLKPSDVNPDEYSAIFYCGGSAPVFDIPDNVPIQNIARQIYEDQGGVVSSVCHGAAGLINIKLSNGDYLVSGKKVNSFTNEEESNGDLLPFMVESKLKERGAVFKSADRWQSHVEVDGRLITGQNPASLDQLAEKIIDVLSLSNSENQ